MRDEDFLWSLGRRINIEDRGGGNVIYAITQQVVYVSHNGFICGFIGQICIIKTWMGLWIEAYNENKSQVLFWGKYAFNMPSIKSWKL